MDNEERASLLVSRYQFDFSEKYHREIRELLQREIQDFQEGSSEYIRFLCGYLFCIGNPDDLSLLKEAKYGINMDVGYMVDWEWLERLRLGEEDAPNVSTREELAADFVRWYRNF